MPMIEKYLGPTLGWFGGRITRTGEYTGFLVKITISSTLARKPMNEP